MAYVFLALAIICELFGTSMLKASHGFTRLLPTAATLIAFVAAFYFLSLSLRSVPLNAAYAIWSGLGTVATVLISVWIWKEKVNAWSVLGIALIVAGVVILNLFGPGHGNNDAQAESDYARKSDINL